MNTSPRLVPTAAVEDRTRDSLATRQLRLATRGSWRRPGYEALSVAPRRHQSCSEVDAARAARPASPSSWSPWRCGSL